MTTAAAVRRVQVTVGNRKVLAEVEPDGKFCWIEVRGRRVRLPFKTGSFTVNLGSGAVSEVPTVPAQGDDDDEGAISAAKRRKVREHAAKYRDRPAPKSERPSVRVAAARVAARQQHEAVWRNAYSNSWAAWARLPLRERVTEQDVDGLVELVMGAVLADRELRDGFRAACDVADQVDGGEPGEVVESGQPVAPAPTPVEPSPTGDDLFAEVGRDITAETLREVRRERSISELINEISEQVGESSVFAEASSAPTPVPMVAERPIVAQTAVQGELSGPVEPRPVWVGELMVGMLAAPVRLFARHTDRHGAELHQVHDVCGSRLSRRMICPQCDRVAEREEIGRTDGERHVTYAEYAGLAAEALKSIELTEFVPVEDLDLPVLAGSTYAVGAGRNGEKAVTALREGLRVEGRAGIGRIVLRSVERVVAVHAVAGELRLSILRWADQVKPAVEVAPVEVSDVELDQCRALIGAMASKWSHGDHLDRREAALAELLDGEPAA